MCLMTRDVVAYHQRKYEAQVYGMARLSAEQIILGGEAFVSTVTKTRNGKERTRREMHPLLVKAFAGAEGLTAAQELIVKASGDSEDGQALRAAMEAQGFELESWAESIEQQVQEQREFAARPDEKVETGSIGGGDDLALDATEFPEPSDDGGRVVSDE